MIVCVMGWLAGVGVAMLLTVKSGNRPVGVGVGTPETVKVTGFVVTLPDEFVNTARYLLPFWDDCAVKLYVVEVAPTISVQVSPPSVLTCHWTVGGGLPVAVTVNETVWPAPTV